MTPIAQIEVVAPNFKRRLSGVTSTIVQLVPLQHRNGVRITTLGPGLPAHLPKMRWWQLPGLWRAPATAPARVWHARRNIEMITGIVLRHILRMPLKLVFTSAAQRHHTAFTRFLIARMDRVIATSARSGSFLRVPHTVIRHGVDTVLFHPATDPTDGTEEMRLPGRYLVGCFGRVRHQKGTDLFVRAMIELLPDYPDWTAVICGRATPEHRLFADNLERAVTEAGLSDRIRFLGEVADVKPWYRRLSLYVAPSRNEGFGLTPLEAMASSTAVVASDAGAYAEMIIPGETGACVPADEFAALRDAIRAYLADPALAERHGRKGLSHVSTHFTLEAEAAALGRIYEDLLDHTTPAA